jgi:hypothetical protein
LHLFVSRWTSRKRRISTIAAAVTALTAVGVAYGVSRFEVVPDEFDPGHSFLVQAAWLGGIGCPTNQRAGQVFQPPAFATTAPAVITDTACPTGDPDDEHVEGLLLAKTGPTANNAAAFAVIRNPPRTITELGWDIRKPGADTSFGARGSHCGAGAPRWNITTRDGRTFFIGCNSPPATTQTPGQGFIRMRWGAGTLAFPAGPGAQVALSTLDVRRLSIVFDEGYDTGPDNFGLAVLDNIDVNTVLVGQGPTDADNQPNGDNDDDNGDDEHGDDEHDD